MPCALTCNRRLEEEHPAPPHVTHLTMTDEHNTTERFARIDEFNYSSHLGRLWVDESLLLSATQRWADCQQAMLDLMAGIPDTPGLVTRLLREQLDVDGNTAGLRGTNNAFISLSNALVFVQQNPMLPASLDQDYIVVGLDRKHRLFELSPRQLLDHLKTADLNRFVAEHWDRYWNARAPHTPVSRRTRVNQLYKSHFEAAAQVAFALGQLSTDQLKPVLTMLDLPNAPDRTVYAERLSFKSADGRALPLHTALVLSIDTVPLTAQLLYTPFRQPVFQLFSERTELESWLIAQQDELLGSTPKKPASEIDYTLTTAHLTDAMDAWLAERGSRLQAALSENTGTDLATHGPTALDAADQRYRNLRVEGFFTAVPSSPTPITEDPDTTPQPFGLLNADLPLNVRLATLRQQRLALEALLDPKHADPLHNLKPHLDTLSAAQNAAQTAATLLLKNKTGLQLRQLRQTLEPAYHALHAARLEGVRAEAEIQQLLGQISHDEYLRLKAVLDYPNRRDRSLPVAACRVVLSQSTRSVDHGSTVVRSQDLNGPLAIIDASALIEPVADVALLLYWPGQAGGLQRFASLRALQAKLFGIHGDDDVLSLHLAEVLTEPFDYSLQSQLQDCAQKAVQIMALHPDATQQSQQTAALNALVEKSLPEWQVHRHAARELAYTQLLEQQRSVELARQRPQWVSALSNDQVAELKPAIAASVDAMRHSQQLFQRDLPSAKSFSQQQVDQRLRRDFSLKQNFTLTLDLPEKVEQQVLVGKGAPGSFSPRTVNKPSAARSKVKLHELALFTVDKALQDRLEFMKVEVTSTDEAERQRLLRGVDAPYARRLISELDVAQQYEDRIVATFLGRPGQSTFSDEYQAQTLLENWRLLLQLQSRIAQVRGHLNADALQILGIAIDANSPEAWNAGNRRIVLKPASLTVGGSDTGSYSATLLGVTFIEEQTSGVTLLYLPDRIDGQFFYRFDNLESARKALFNWCLRDEMSQYLAGRALGGEVEKHAHRIKQAVLRNYDAIMGVGVPWPASTSLAKNLLNVHMGQVLEAHRATSRSNSTQLMRELAGSGAQAVYFIKLAMGFVPFIGTAIGLYDAWVMANLAVAAFLRGELQDGFDALASCLHALIDAGVDLGTGMGVAQNASKSRVRLRQLEGLSQSAGALSPPSLRKSLNIAGRFAGYEYEQPISLHGLQPHHEGIYRNVYRHPQGDFILSQGRVFEVQLDVDLHTLRMKGTRTRSYKQPIVLDEAGEWNTHGAVYGTLVNGGLAGGGGVLGHLADRLDPIWPLAIRERLPVWWTDRAWRQQLRLQDEAMALGNELSNRIQRAKRLELIYLNAEPQNKPTARNELYESLRAANDVAIRHDRAVEQLPRPVGREAINGRQGLRQANAAIIVRNSIELAKGARRDLQVQVTQFGALTIDRIDTASVINLLKQRKTISIKVRETLDDLEQHAQTANAWHDKIRNEREFQYTETDHTRLPDHRRSHTELSADLAELNTNFGADYRRYLRFSFSLETLHHFETISEFSWFYLRQQTLQRHIEVARTLYVHYTLDRSNATRSQRVTLLEGCIQGYETFSRDLKTWNLGYPQHFDQPRLIELLTDLEKMVELAHRDMGITPTRPRNATFNVFTTDENQLLIGTETTPPNSRTRQFTIENPAGPIETWNVDPQSNRARLDAPPPRQSAPTTDSSLARSTLVNEAQSRLNGLDGYKHKIQNYAQQNTAPVDLEYMLVSEAGELTVRANRIQRVAPDEAIIGQLRSKAQELTAAGRSLRIQQSMISQTPTGAYLDHLLTPHPTDPKRYVRLNKLGERIANGRRQDGRPDFYQEYAVHDLTQTGEPVLWYAHAHYDSATTPFDTVVKAHLKLPEQRHLGLEWQKQQPAHNPIWRGDISRTLFIKHFANL